MDHVLMNMRLPSINYKSQNICRLPVVYKRIANSETYTFAWDKKMTLVYYNLL